MAVTTTPGSKCPQMPSSPVLGDFEPHFFSPPSIHVFCNVILYFLPLLPYCLTVGSTMKRALANGKLAHSMQVVNHSLPRGARFTVVLCVLLPPLPLVFSSLPQCVHISNFRSSIRRHRFCWLPMNPKASSAPQSFDG